MDTQTHGKCSYRTFVATISAIMRNGGSQVCSTCIRTQHGSGTYKRYSGRCRYSDGVTCGPKSELTSSVYRCRFAASDSSLSISPGDSLKNGADIPALYDPGLELFNTSI